MTDERQIELEEDPIESLRLWRENKLVLGPDYKDRLFRLLTLAVLKLDERRKDTP